MESTNQDDDSTFESKEEDNNNGKLLHFDNNNDNRQTTGDTESHRSILSKIAHHIYLKKFKAPHHESSSANVDFRCEDEDENQKITTTPSSSGPVAEQLKSIAETGLVDSIDWPTLQQALRDRLDEVLEKYLEKNPDCKDEQYQEPNVGKFNLESSKDEILEMIASFNEAPFTIQRICELLYSPFKYYDKTSTFLRGLEKNLRVISSNDWPKSLNDPVVMAPPTAASVATVAPQDTVENNCTPIDTAHLQQTTSSSEHLSSSQELQQQEQQHEEMNQCEEEDQQEPILAQPSQPQSAPEEEQPQSSTLPSETQLESSSTSMSSSPPPQPPTIQSPLKEVT